MTQYDKYHTEQPRDEWTSRAAQDEMQKQYQRRKLSRQERKRQMEARNAALRSMAGRNTGSDVV